MSDIDGLMCVFEEMNCGKEGKHMATRWLGLSCSSVAATALNWRLKPGSKLEEELRLDEDMWVFMLSWLVGWQTEWESRIIKWRWPSKDSRQHSYTVLFSELPQENWHFI